MDQSSFAGQVALVTGGGSGIGLALARAIAEEGASVAVTDIDAEAAQAAVREIRAAGGRAHAQKLDVTSRDDWDAAIEATQAEFGPIDLLCSNAGSNSCQLPLVRMPLQYMRWLFEVNVLGAVNGAQALVPGMIARGRGWLLFTGSMAGLGETPFNADYCATKHALLAIADCLREEVREAGLRVSYLCPAAVPSNLARTTRRHLAASIVSQLPPAQAGSAAEKQRAVSESGGFVDADRVAQIALDGLREGRFLIPTHPRSGARARARIEQFEAAIAAIEAAGAPE